MKLTQRLLPHPMLSLLLLVIWLLLNNTIAPGHILLGMVFALTLPWITSAFWPADLRLHRPTLALRFTLLVLWDIVIANFDVARIILNPRSTPQPGFIELPLDTENEFAITVLAAVISLTPGTVSIDASENRTSLLIHSLNVDDEAAMVAHLKARYEAPIKEIFGC